MRPPASLELVLVVAMTTPQRGIGLAGSLPWHLPPDMAHFRSLTRTPVAPGRVNAVVMGRKSWDSIPVRHRPLQDRINVVLTRRPAAFLRRVYREGLLGPQVAAPASGASNAASPPPPCVACDPEASAVHVERDTVCGAMRDGVVPHVLAAASMDDALHQLCGPCVAPVLGRVFVVGGERVFAEAMRRPQCTTAYVTEVTSRGDALPECDTVFPPWYPSDDAWRRNEAHPVAAGTHEHLCYTIHKYERVTNTTTTTTTTEA